MVNPEYLKRYGQQSKCAGFSLKVALKEASAGASEARSLVTGIDYTNPHVCLGPVSTSAVHLT